MKAINFTERRKRIVVFAGIYGATIILLLFILSAFGMRFTANDRNTKAEVIPQTADLELLHADSLLHTELQELQLSDFSYRLLPDTTNVIEKNNALTAVADAESAIKKTMDSIEQMTSAYTGSEETRYRTMLNTFKLVLSDRAILKNTQSSLVLGKTTTANTTQDISQLKNDLLIKENDISRMEAEIKTLKSVDLVPSKTSGTGEAQKGENELLKTAFNDQQKELDALKEKYTRLRNDNSILNTQLAEIKKPAVVQTDNLNVAMDNRVNMLQQKIEGLNADLYFAKIDCNLARTDAQQMISNARQRKELLSESLTMLTRLSKSDDGDVQKKAKEKIERLNRIASTLHD